MARTIDHMITTGQEFDETRLEKQNEKQLKKREFRIRRQALEPGFQLTPVSS